MKYNDKELLGKMMEQAWSDQALSRYQKRRLIARALIEWNYRTHEYGPTDKGRAILGLPPPKEPAKNEPPKMYMNILTGSVDVYDGWYYEINGERVNAVDRGEVLEVTKTTGGNWIEVK